jgi:two-component system CheB/CheR fusion protein
MMPSASNDNRDARRRSEPRPREDRAARSEPTIVGIGASAGGLAALRAFFAHVPDDSGLAFVVVVHLAPDHESHLAELLQPHVRIPVQQVTETMSLQANRVYVIPPGCNLSAVDTHLRLSDLEKRRGERHLIDHFFRTLAQTHDGSSVAIVLTGTGSDGTLGIAEIKRQNGLTVVQDPDEAEFDGMPRSAVTTGLVDLVLPLAEIPGAIIRYASTQPRVPVPDEDASAERDEQDLLRTVFTLLRTRTRRDFTRYKQATILRRITRRMKMVQVEDLESYVAMLQGHPEEVIALAEDFLVTVTSFFRDPDVFDALASNVLPSLFEGRAPHETIRVWSVGCATGEEAYSLAILLLEEAGRREAPPQIQVFASDLHDRSLRRARGGLYVGDIAADVGEERLARYFTKTEDGYRVRKEVRQLVVFAPHNVLSDPPFSKLDVVVCRNVMIYLQRAAQGEVMGLFHYALRPGGILVLGPSETVEDHDLFLSVDERLRVYRKRNLPAAESRLPVFPVTWSHALHTPSVVDMPFGAPVDHAVLHRRMMDAVGPPSLLLNADDKVVHLSQHAGRFLALPGGEMTTSVFRLVREELRVELRTALHAARMLGKPAESKAVPVVLDGSATQTVVLHVWPPIAGGEDYTLVVFEEHPSLPVQTPVPEEGEPWLAAVEAERDLAQERLQTLIAVHEASQEEMRAANEELQSANEELRSTMEELETSKEELQSMNEELQTVNQENRHKVEELAQLSSDLANHLAATDIATLFLDCSLRIMRFTPQVSHLFNIRNTDRSRPLADLTNRLGYDEIVRDAENVLQTLTPIEREVQDDKGRWYLSRVLPYRSTEDKIEGVVLTFIEISARVRAEATVRASEERLREMAETVPDVLFTAAPDGTVDYASSQIERLLGIDPELLVGTRMWPDLVHPDNQEEAQRVWDEATRTLRRYEIRYRLRNAKGTYCWVFLRARPVTDRSGAVTRWYGTITDVDALTQAEHEVQALNASLEARVEERTARIRELSARLVNAEQQERQRLAHVLHDDLQQQLAALAMTLQLLRTAASDEDRKTLWMQVDRIVETSTSLTRSLSTELSPPALASTDIGDTIRWLADRKREMFHLDVNVQIDEICEVPDATVRAALYQALREILLNVVKHARTRRATLRCHRVGDQIVTVVEDEGDGFDPGSVRMTGLGLYSVGERLAGFGGRLDVDSKPGRGTRITLTIPAGESGTTSSSDKDSTKQTGPGLEWGS